MVRLTSLVSGAAVAAADSQPAGYRPSAYWLLAVAALLRMVRLSLFLRRCCCSEVGDLTLQFNGRLIQRFEVNSSQVFMGWGRSYASAWFEMEMRPYRAIAVVYWIIPWHRLVSTIPFCGRTTRSKGTLPSNPRPTPGMKTPPAGSTWLFVFQTRLNGTLIDDEGLPKMKVTVHPPASG